jgi:hypothetical protein
LKAETVRNRTQQQVNMTSETNEGIAYLAALKRPEIAAPATAIAEAGLERNSDSALASQNAGSQQSFRGPEKRRSPRYLCEGSVEMREEGCDVRTWATVTDISLHGCYVEAPATYRAGTVLHLKLDAVGIRVEARGTVRVDYPYLGMGIAFNEMPDEERSRLRLLLTSITRPCVVMSPPVMAPPVASAPPPASEPLPTILLITCPEAAIQQLVEFFATRSTLPREDFLRILRVSQSPKEP